MLKSNHNYYACRTHVELKSLLKSFIMLIDVSNYNQDYIAY